MNIDREKLKTGIPLIDRQHKEYADLVDRVFQQVELQDESKAKPCEAVMAVLKYAIEHFDAEEALMESENYPALEPHRTKHNHFRNKADSMIPELQKATDLNEFMLDMSKWLVSWFIDQVQDDDVKLAEYLKKNGHASLS